jgi:hypothetical protein
MTAVGGQNCVTSFMEVPDVQLGLDLSAQHLPLSGKSIVVSFLQEFHEFLPHRLSVKGFRNITCNVKGKTPWQARGGSS